MRFESHQVLCALRLAHSGSRLTAYALRAVHLKLNFFDSTTSVTRLIIHDSRKFHHAAFTLWTSSRACVIEASVTEPESIRASSSSRAAPEVSEITVSAMPLSSCLLTT